MTRLFLIRTCLFSLEWGWNRSDRTLWVIVVSGPSISCVGVLISVEVEEVVVEVIADEDVVEEVVLSVVVEEAVLLSVGGVNLVTEMSLMAIASSTFVPQKA